MTHWRRGNLHSDEKSPVLGWSAWGRCGKSGFAGFLRTGWTNSCQCWFGWCCLVARGGSRCLAEFLPGLLPLCDDAFALNSLSLCKSVFIRGLKRFSEIIISFSSRCFMRFDVCCTDFTDGEAVPSITVLYRQERECSLRHPSPCERAVL